MRVFAGDRRLVEVVEWEHGSARRTLALAAEPGGYFSGLAPFLRPGSHYGFRLDGGAELYPDPASRFQPDGPHGPSQVVDPGHPWTDAGWRGVTRRGLVVYELHVGTFTAQGTFTAASRELPELARLGITLVELMPVADFPGRFGWGYDGVDLFAPSRLYGPPADLKAFVDRAHAFGVGVILDVVYNHLGPDGNYTGAFSRDYYTSRHENEWGEAINFDGPGCGPVRELFVENAAYWIEEYHMDGLRLDATQQIFDSSEPHVVAELASRVRSAAAALGRSVYLVAENEPQHSRLVRPREAGGYGLDALWNDDFHHAARVALTGRHEAYYSDYRGTPQELLSAARRGYLFQGQRYSWQRKRRGRPALDVGAERFVAYLENHDQVANSIDGVRLDRLTSPGRLRASTALLLLAPSTPMLFQGQEFASSAPFLYFADHTAELAALVRRGRADFLRQFPSIAAALDREDAAIADPSSPATFERCKLDFGERERHAPVYALHADLLRLRRTDPAFSAERSDLVHGAVLSDRAFVLRFFCEEGDRLVVVNLGADLDLVPAPEPLLAPPPGLDWRLVWSSEDPRYGGRGAPRPYARGGWRLPAESAFVFDPVPAAFEGDDADEDTPAEQGRPASGTGATSRG